MRPKNLVFEATAEIHIDVPSELTGMILEALQPEVDSPSSERTSAQVLMDDAGVIIRTHASDTTALRASLNSYLRWIQGMLDLISILD